MISTEISPDVAALVERLIDSKPGDLVSYGALTAVVGRDVRGEHRWLVLRAMDVAARDHGAIFGNERGKGYVRLAAEDAHTIGSTARSAIKRKARKAGKLIRFATSRQNSLSPDAARKANAELSVLGLLEHLSRDKNAAPQEVHERRPEPVAIVGQRLMEAMR
jgi:hypothetical protein